ncbi:MAG: PQQ-dependent dehydrogenase, methanol/ethanol family [Trueperaceae bacterium]
MTHPTTFGAGWLNRLALAFTAAVLLTVGAGAALANEEVLNLQDDHSMWVMPNQNYAGWNYSELDRINRHNVDNLRVAWAFQTGVLDSHEAQPLVIGSTMYVLTPKPNTLYALDLTRQGFIKWSFAPEMDTERAGSLACCGAQTRGMMYAEGKILFNTLDGQLFAVNANDGSVAWDTQVADLDLGETTTTNPLVVGDNVIIGNEGGERGVRGWVAAYDLNSGEQQWKFYSTGPNEDMGIGERFNPFYADDQVEEPGVQSWYEDSWEHGGGTNWGYWTYDQDTNLFFYGTSNCAPWNPDYRRDPATAPGFDEYGNKYCASLLARDATSGELVWAYSVTPQDQWDFDEPGQNFLVDLEMDGEMRKTLVKPARNGFFYVFDRETGEILNEPFTYTSVNWASSIDLDTGRPVFNEETIAYTDVEIPICPFIAGNNWFNDAYSPRTGLVYFAAENRCSSLTPIEGEFTAGENYILMKFGQSHAGPGGYLGELQAWDPVTGEKAWGIKTQTSRNAFPVLATAGDLIFQGTDKGELRAVDARNGQVLWSFRTGSNFRNSPISYVGPDGKQYLAVISSQAPRDPEIGEDTEPEAEGRYRRAGSTLYVFSLP